MDLGRFARPSIALPVGAIISWFLYLIGLAIYRLYLSPLAKFPGPKLAALTKWYEFYYDVVKQGKFTFHIQDLHKKYGPIVRITPYELHVEDSDYWDELYSRNAKSDKYEWLAGRFGNANSVFTTPSHEIHAIRRGALNQFFSKRSVLALEPMIWEKLEKLCKHIAEYKETGKYFRLNMAWSAYSGDVITQYSLGLCYDHLDIPDFAGGFHESFMEAGKFGHVALQFPFLFPLLNRLPEKMVDDMNPGMHELLVLQKDLKKEITRITNGEIKKEKEDKFIFHEILESNIPPQEKSVQRLAEEAQVVIGAGLETTAWTASVASFHIINSPAVFRKLRAELKSAIPDPNAKLDVQELEKLPYLTACIQEGIRLAYGVSTRNPRISPTKPTKYKKWVIPPGTPVSMTILDVHHDERNFPDSHSFIPERWLDNPKTENGSNLNRYFVAFGKGSRQCLGINLAYAELYLGLAAVFRRFTLELYETDVSDVVCTHDLFMPSPKLDSKGVRVKVRSIDD